MKKWAVVLATILLLSTIIMFGYCRTSVVGYATELAGLTDTSKLSEWEYAGNFSKNEIILVDLLQNIHWSENVTYFDVVANIPTLWVTVNITDPAHTTSEYELAYTYQATDVSHRLLAYNLTILSNATEINPFAPIKETGVTFVAGTAEQNGTYVANVTSVSSDVLEFRQTDLKPSFFALYKARAVVTYPYSILSYAGFVTGPACIAFAVYGLQSDHRKERSKSTKAEN